MKYSLTLLIFILTMISGFCFSQEANSPADTSQTNTVRVLELKYPQLADRVSEVYGQDLPYDWYQTVFVINVKKITDDYEFRIKILRKDEIPSILRDTKNPLYGYFEFNFRPALVFGDSADCFFSETNDSIGFDWLKPSPPRKKPDSGEVHIPPRDHRYVWLYRFEKGEFNFYKKCHYKILDLPSWEEYYPAPTEQERKNMRRRRGKKGSIE